MRFVFTPDDDFHGVTQIDYTISDGNNDIDVAKFVTVDPINDAPVITLTKRNNDDSPDSDAEWIAEANVADGFERFFSLSDFVTQILRLAYFCNFDVPDIEVGTYSWPILILQFLTYPPEMGKYCN